MDTDHAWEQWGKKDPYFGVITNAKFRLANITEDAKAEFLESGKVHTDYVFEMIRLYISPIFHAKRGLDFGCGVGRVLIPLAQRIESMVGIDVSTSMLAEAQRNCQASGLQNVELLQGGNDLKALAGQFDLVHSYIVFQHIPSDRGLALFADLVAALRTGGIGALHVTYSKQHFSDRSGLPPPTELAETKTQQLQGEPKGRVAPNEVAAEQEPQGDPEMQMNPYSATQLLFVLQQAGIHRFHVEFTDHGGELGLFFFFQAP